MEKLYLLTFLLFAATSVESFIFGDPTDELIGSLLKLKLSVFDDDGNLVSVTFNKSDLIPDLSINVDDRVRFFLYARDSMTEEELFVNDLNALKLSHFDPKRETKFVTHGWINSKRSEACTLVKDAFLKHGDYNVIVVDWSPISLRPYLYAASHVEKVGKRVAKMIDFLSSNGMNLTTTTVVGHSLGAHIAGLAGYYSKGKVNYVVGLDPALPFFALKTEGHRISTKDAKNVEIIHTNAGMLGYLDPIGHADFYLNGGSQQLGCIIDVGGSCSHCRSYKFFSESIMAPNGFHGKRCIALMSLLKGSCGGEDGIMGGVRPYLPYNGNYYVPTKAEAPYVMDV